MYYEQVSQAFLTEENKLRRLYKAFAKGDGDFSFHSDFKMSMRQLRVPVGDIKDFIETNPKNPKRATNIRIRYD